MSINRRDLIKLAVVTWVLPSCVKTEVASPVKSLPERLFFGFDLPDEKGQKQSGVMAYDFASAHKTVLENEIHSITYSPEHDLKVFIPKQGKVAYFQRGDSPLVAFAPAKGKFFYGHGAFDERRNVFYSTQSTVVSPDSRELLYDEGEIQVYSLDDFRIVDTFPSFGFNPHDVKIVNDELIVCNGGDNSNVVWISLADRKLQRSYGLKNSPHISFGHLDMVDTNRLVVAAASRSKTYPCPLYLVDREKGLTVFEIPEPLRLFFVGQLLSVIHHEGYVYATCPATGHVFVWNIAGTFLSAVPVHNASSLVYSPSRKGVIVGSGNRLEPLRLLTAKGPVISLTEVAGPKTQTGSHALLIAPRV